ncbi:hypothetical protein DWW16_11370 [Bacteroides clarus]|uniref:Uncharacterized protein n=1 Tax=Bacteroides clarus TaxID=626929 RepID=A0A412Y833_9BACE|nr:hypothetical protein DWW16_11370 [Bacteroides clarus]RGV53575.1 hypothetical protein DWW09_10060 [Bacteroides clarus]
MCQNSPCIEITPATIICGEGDFLFMRVSTHPLYCFAIPQGNSRKMRAQLWNMRARPPRDAGSDVTKYGLSHNKACAQTQQDVHPDTTVRALRQGIYGLPYP